MTKRFGAVFAEGVLVPQEPLELPDQQFVECSIITSDSSGDVSDNDSSRLALPPEITRVLSWLQHELSQPVWAARGAIEMARMELQGRAVELSRPYFEDAQMWLDLMGQLITHLDMGSSRFNPEPLLMMADVVAPSVRHVEALTKERGFSLKRIRYGVDEWKRFPRLRADRQQLCQLLFNLLSNAIKYADRDPLKFRVEIEPEVIGNVAIVRVRDWGVGVNLESRDHIFDVGFRDPFARTFASGAGVGLAVARNIAVRHGGKLELTNLNTPTEFTLTLPTVVNPTSYSSSGQAMTI